MPSRPMGLPSAGGTPPARPRIERSLASTTLGRPFGSLATGPQASHSLRVRPAGDQPKPPGGNGGGCRWTASAEAGSHRHRRQNGCASASSSRCVSNPGRARRVTQWCSSCPLKETLGVPATLPNTVPHRAPRPASRPQGGPRRQIAPRPRLSRGNPVPSSLRHHSCNTHVSPAAANSTVPCHPRCPPMPQVRWCCLHPSPPSAALRITT
jgi:hypothetical protein